VRRIGNPWERGAKFLANSTLVVHPVPA